MSDLVTDMLASNTAEATVADNPTEVPTVDANATPVAPKARVKKIKCFRGDNSACWGYRLHTPMAELAKNHKDYVISITGVLDTRDLAGQDMVIMQRQYKADVFYPMLKMKQNGIKLVYEIDDDLFNVPDWNPASKVFNNKTVQDNIKHFLTNIDAVFTTTERLRDLYSKYCAKVFVLPNSIDYNIVHKPPRNSKKKVVCWQGSASHVKDISLIEPALTRLSKDNDAFIKVWDIDIDVKDVYRMPFVPYAAFYQMFAQLDGYIGLAPLTTAPFNRGKSNLKWLEYTAYDMVTVASPVGPYAESIEHGVTGWLVNPNNSDWYDSIRYLLDHEDVYNEILKNAKEKVAKEYNIKNNYVCWKEAIDELIGK